MTDRNISDDMADAARLRYMADELERAGDAPEAVVGSEWEDWMRSAADQIERLRDALEWIERFTSDRGDARMMDAGQARAHIHRRAKVARSEGSDAARQAENESRAASANAGMETAAQLGEAEAEVERLREERDEAVNKADAQWSAEVERLREAIREWLDASAALKAVDTSDGEAIRDALDRVDAAKATARGLTS